MTGPMQGLRILEVGDLGEVAGKLLADAGADLILVEPPAGARSRRTGPFVEDLPTREGSLHYAYLNTNKRGVTLDLSQPDGQDLWRRLVAQTDIVIDGAGLEVLDGFGLGYDAFSEAEHLIWCSITPFGRTGPWRHRPTSDLISMALGGIVMMCGYDDHSLPPVRPEGEHSRYIAGEYAVVGILAALWQRVQLGLGQLVDVSMHEAISSTTEGAYMNWEYLGRNPERQTGRHAGTAERWQLLCADGKYAVLFGGGVPRAKKALQGLLAWMDEYDAAADLHDPKYEQLLHIRPAEGGELRKHFADTVAGFVGNRPMEEVYRRGQEIGMPWGPVRLPEENLDDPHWADRDFWVTASVAGHPELVRYPRAGYRMGQTPIEFRTPAPALGEHNAAVFINELGVTSDELARLQERGVV
ncbi:MAG: hypothetical protein GEU80_11970 [Dehalococcoidia bacterium]|nr:hypothetical protein [Dehalococcoidia bacterium]